MGTFPKRGPELRVVIRPERLLGELDPKAMFILKV